MDDTAISVLNHLIETCKDGEQGFKVAADGLSSAGFKSKFIEYSRQRSQMARQLQDEVRGLGGDPEKSGSVAGTVHRGWMNIRAVVSGKDDHAIVAEAERGEDSAKSAFDEALRAPLPTSAHALIEQFGRQVHQAHDDVRAMRDRETGNR